jgi:hypothetical protein
MSRVEGGSPLFFGRDSAPKLHAGASISQEHKRRICGIRRPLGKGSREKLGFVPEMVLAFAGGVLVIY